VDDSKKKAAAGANSEAKKAASRPHRLANELRRGLQRTQKAFAQAGSTSQSMTGNASAAPPTCGQAISVLSEQGQV